MKRLKRIIVIVLDSAGVGALPDADHYGDAGANTIGHIAETVGLTLPVMGALGLGNILPLRGVEPDKTPGGFWGKAASRSSGKDTTSGHWEIAGLVMREALPTWPRGFPPELLGPFEQAIGRKSLGNKVASGTEILDELGEEHVRSGQPIVYTSADSVFQIATHEDVVPLDTLYSWCKIARELIPAGRIIARPFAGSPGAWQRTANRHDYSLEPPGATVLDLLAKTGLPVIGVGKIADIFAGRGISQSHPVAGNHAGMTKTIELAAQPGSGLIFTNLVDFDMKYGHRRDVMGYKQALEEFDARLPDLQAQMRDGDLAIITADHGCDPTYRGTDHTREYIPILAFGPGMGGGPLGTRQGFADIAATIAELLIGPEAAVNFPMGKSFATELGLLPLGHDVETPI